MYMQSGPWSSCCTQLVAGRVAEFPVERDGQASGTVSRAWRRTTFLTGDSTGTTTGEGSEGSEAAAAAADEAATHDSRQMSACGSRLCRLCASAGNCVAQQDAAWTPIKMNSPQRWLLVRLVHASRCQQAGHASNIWWLLPRDS